MKRYTLLLLFFLGSFLQLFASHNIAGEITVQCLGGLQVKATITTYTNTLSSINRCELTIDWGDGTQSILNRINGPLDPQCPNATGSQPVSGYPNAEKNDYEGTHIYSGPSTYHITLSDPNREAGINNIFNSASSPFFLETSITLNPLLSCNSTPVLMSAPLDYACLNHCYVHNPGAVDPEGDSLSYSIGAVFDSTGQQLQAPYFYMPDSPPPAGAGGTMMINATTGDLTWCSPGSIGTYNVAIFVYEWRKLNGVPVNVSIVERELQIKVAPCSNNPPDLPDLPDLCVDAGDTINFNFTATDPDSGDQLELTASGEPFQHPVPPSDSATLTPSGAGVYHPAPLTANFHWPTDCELVRLQPYTVHLKVRDNDLQVPLVDVESFNITIVSPGPQVLTAIPSGTSMQLNWSVNPCDPVANRCVGYKIYRKTGPSGWSPAQCETGVPAYTGFVYIGSVTGVNNTSFTDNNNGNGLVSGVNYCYRVHAVFADGAKSYASPEACNELKRDVPIIAHVDVVSTGSSDTIGVSWYNAVADINNFDTTTHIGPYQLRIYRATGTSFANATQIAVLNSNYFLALPDTFTDSGLNTIGTPYTYRIALFALGGGDSIGATSPASSIFLAASTSDNTVSLSWNEQVPWTNFRYDILRKDPTASSFVQVASVTGHHYDDTGLVNGSDYCYIVRAAGSYFNPALPDTLFNRSQQVCATPEDHTAPCAPQLGVNSDCFNFLNQLEWINPMHLNCGTDDVVSYHIWYKPTEDGAWSQLATVTNAGDTIYTQHDLVSVAGCYAITALDTFANESAYSNIVCVDNCPEYVLPNVFSPNGDGSNDQLIPFPFRYVESVDFKIFDRWGVLVYETTDPHIKWDGRNKTNNALCTDGVYYYVCTVNEIRQQGIVPRQLTGFVHLFGKDADGPK